MLQRQFHQSFWLPLSRYSPTFQCLNKQLFRFLSLNYMAPSKILNLHLHVKIKPDILYLLNPVVPMPSRALRPLWQQILCCDATSQEWKVQYCYNLIWLEPIFQKLLWAKCMDPHYNYEFSSHYFLFTNLQINHQKTSQLVKKFRIVY